MNKYLLVGVWGTTTLFLLFLAFGLFVSLPFHPAPQVKGASTKNVELKKSYQMYTAIPSYENTVEETISITDARIEIVRQFLEKYKSPLEPHAAHLIQTADKYHLDFRLLPAVAMQESGLCKFIPEDSHNCWGYGIYGDKVLKFPSYIEAIEAVGKGISSDYVHDGLSTPELIMKRYTPSSNGSWAESVRHFMEEME